MSKPNHTQFYQAIGDRIETVADDTNTNGLYRAIAPDQDRPGRDDDPLVVFVVRADYSHTDTKRLADLTIRVLVVRHTYSNPEDADAIVTLIADALDKWTPTVAGICTNQLVLAASDTVSYDDEHVAEELTFNSHVSEGA